MRQIFLSIFIFVLAGCTGGIESWIHNDVDEAFIKQKFTVQQLHQDIDFLLKTMQNRHPAFDSYADQQALIEKVNEIKHHITSPMTRKHVFPLFAQLTPYFNDGHSILFPLLAETTFMEKQNIQTFPFGVRIQDGSIYLLRSYVREKDNRELVRGTSIKSINGHSAHKILSVLGPMGHGETKLLRESMLSLLFYFWLNAVFDINGDITLEYAFQEKQDTVVLAHDDTWQRTEDEVKDYELRILDGGIGHLRIASFDVSEDESSYKEFIQKAFAELANKQIAKLIIDVRGNTGGQSDAGAEVIQYLIDKPVTQASIAFEKLNDDNNGLFGYKGKPGDIIELDVAGDGTIDPIDAEERYRGDVIVLMDRMTYSAGILFVTAVKDHKLGKLAGEPTGGFANQTGNLTPFYLPNTKLLMLAPARYIIRPSGDPKSEPVDPDFLLLGSDTSKQDIWLEQAMSLFKKSP